MRKLNILLFSFILLFVPSQVLATVDLTLKDNSTTSLKSISVNIETIDVLEEILVTIKPSANVSVTEVSSGTITCTSFQYNTEKGVVEIICPLSSPLAVEGVLANILFTSEDDDYSFEVVDNGSLELGDVVNIGTLTVDDMMEEENTTTVLEEEDLLVTNTEKKEEKTFGFNLETLTEYLPYILIAGSAILLISIIGILLSKKKTPEQKEPITTEVSSTPLDNQPTDLNNISEAISTGPTLKDIVNKENATDGQTTPEVGVVQEPDSGMTQTLDTPLQTNPVTATNFSPSEEQDLQDLMQKESMVGSMPAQPIAEVAPIATESIATTPNTPVESPAPITSVNVETPITPNVSSSMVTEPSTPPITPVENTISETPPISPTTQESVPPMSEVQGIAQTLPESTPSETPPISPTTQESVSPMSGVQGIAQTLPETPITNPQDLQNSINAQISQIDTTAPVTSTTDTNETNAEDLPPVPPTM